MNRAKSVQRLEKRLADFKIVQGPLAGVSHHVFREGVWLYSEPAWVCSEMVSCHTIAHGDEALHRRFLHVSDLEGPMCLQIAAGNCQDVEAAFSVINQLKVSMVDLNAGCPVKKIRKKHMGSALLEDPARLMDILMAMQSCAKVPISVKVRLQKTQRMDDRVIDVVNTVGVDFLTVHGRTYQDGYDVGVDYQRIQYFAKYASMNVIGNGDVCDLESAQKMMSTDVSGVMIGRYGVGQPWLIGGIQKKLGGEGGVKRPDQNPLILFYDHVKKMAEFPGGEKFAMLSGYGLIKYYAKRNQLPPGVIDQVRQCQSIAELKRWVMRVKD